MPDIESDLVLALRSAAETIGAATTDAPAQLVGEIFNSEMLSDALSENPLRRQRSDLPLFVEALLLDGFPVLIGQLTGPPSRPSLGPQLIRYRNQATIARSWVGAEAPNLHLFLAGPDKAFANPEWRQLAAEIEADDRVCRKLVWLFDEEPTKESALEFLERTFIARPWPTEQRAERLDSIATFSLPNGWEEALENADLDSAALVERFIELRRGEAP